MAEELIDIYDENNNPLGIQKKKNAEAHKEGLWHRAAHIWIYNPKGELLLQKRAKDKILYPNMWDISAAGHVGLGEKPAISGLRELEEEIGILAKEKDLEFLSIRKTKAIYKDIKNNEFYYVFLMKFDGALDELKIQEEELEEIKFIPLDKLEKDIKTNPDKYVPHGEYWDYIIKEIRKRT